MNEAIDSAKVSPAAGPGCNGGGYREALNMTIGRLAGRLTDKGRTSPGTLAELRRLAGGAKDGAKNAAFWRLLTQDVAESLRGSAEREALWAALLAAFATLAPLGSGRGRRLGTELGESGYAEPRLVRLLRADRDTIADQLHTAAQWLARQGRPADWREIADFTLSRLCKEAGSDDRAARRIAHDYFTAIARAEGTRA